MRRILLLALALPAYAQEQEIQRALIERDQRTVEFAARLRGAPPVALQQLEDLAARQLLGNLALEPRPDARQVAARETEAFVLRLPPPVVRIPVPEVLRPREGGLPRVEIVAPGA
jgi:hypothetical protein